MLVFDSSRMNLAVQLKLLPDRSFLLPNHCRQSLSWGGLGKTPGLRKQPRLDAHTPFCVLLDRRESICVVAGEQPVWARLDL